MRRLVRRGGEKGRRGGEGEQRVSSEGERTYGVKVVCLVLHPSSGSSELACAMD